MSDLISRQSAIDALIELSVQRDEWDSKEGFAQKRGIDAAICAIEDLPSAERSGRWVTYKRHTQGSPYIAFGEDGKPFIQHHQIEVTRYKCSLCGVVEDVNTPFCSECGARMEVE